MANESIPVMSYILIGLLSCAVGGSCQMAIDTNQEKHLPVILPTNQEIADQTYNKIMLHLESMEKDADRMDKNLEAILKQVRQNNKELQETVK